MSGGSSSGRVEDSEILNIHQWNAIQRFGGGKVAVAKARKVAMKKLQVATGTDVGYEYMFTGDNVREPADVSAPSGAKDPVDPLFLDDGGLFVVNRRDPSPKRQPGSGRRSPSPLSDAGSSPDFRPVEPPSEVSTTPSSPPHGSALRPKVLRAAAEDRRISTSPERRLSMPDGRETVAEEVQEILDESLEMSEIAENEAVEDSEARDAATPELLKDSSPVKRPASPPVPRSASSPPRAGTASDRLQKDRPQTASPSRKFKGDTKEYWEERNKSARRSAARADQFFRDWKAGQARPGSPPHRRTQPRSHGAMRSIEIRSFCFDEAHPALAEEHFKRSEEQNEFLLKEKRDEAKRQKMLRLRMERESTIASVSRPSSRAPSMFGGTTGGRGKGGPTPEELVRKLERIKGSMKTGGKASKGGEADGSEDLNAQLRAAQARAKAAISASSRKSAAMGSGSRERPWSPPRPRSVSPLGRSSPDIPSAKTAWEAIRSAGALGQDIPALDKKVEQLQEKIAEQAGHEMDSPGPAETSVRDSQDTDPSYTGHFSFRTAGHELLETPKPVSPLKSQKAWDAQDAPIETSLADYTAEAANRKLEPALGREVAAAPPKLPKQSDASQPGQDRTDAELELMVAAGKYDTKRYQDYQQELDQVMESRRQQGIAEECLPHGYESDLDREEAEERARELEEEEAHLEELRRFPERRTFFAAERAESLTADWLKENEWMDEYRTHKQNDDSFTYVFDDEAGDYIPEQDMLAKQKQATQPQEASSGVRNPNQPPIQDVLSMDDLAMLNASYIPFVQDNLPVYGIEETRAPSQSVDAQGRLSPVFWPISGTPAYYSDGETEKVYWPLTRAKSKIRKKRVTAPQPFRFEHHQNLPQKTIMASKLESELIIKRQEEERARTTPFVAKPMPAATLEPRFAALHAEQEIVRESNKLSSHQWHKAIEAPFSFYFTDKLREEAKQEERRKLTDPNRFQQNFKAKNPPSHIYEDRYRDLQAAEEVRKQSRVLRAEMLLGGAALPSRMARAEVDREFGGDDEKRRRRKAKHASVDPEWQTKYRRRPLGYTPDFDQLHADFEFEAAKTRARVRRGVTVPEEFNLSGTNRKENAARRMRVMEGRKKQIVDILIDQEELPEYRWPFVMPRGRVPPSIPPASFVHQKSTAMDPTAASAERGKVVSKENKKREERQAKAEAERKEKERRERAREHILKKMKNQGPTTHDTSYISAQDSLDHDDTQEVAEGSAGNSAGNVVPPQYLQARYKQAEGVAKEQFQETLLVHGIDALRFKEEEDGTTA